MKTKNKSSKMWNHLILVITPFLLLSNLSMAYVEKGFVPFIEIEANFPKLGGWNKLGKGWDAETHPSFRAGCFYGKFGIHLEGFEYRIVPTVGNGMESPLYPANVAVLDTEWEGNPKVDAQYFGGGFVYMISPFNSKFELMIRAGVGMHILQFNRMVFRERLWNSSGPVPTTWTGISTYPARRVKAFSRTIGVKLYRVIYRGITVQLGIDDVRVHIKQFHQKQLDVGFGLFGLNLGVGFSILI